MFAGQVMLGFCVSATVTVKRHCGPDCALQTTVVAPTGKSDPEAGVQVTVPQPAVVVGAKVTCAPQTPRSFARDVSLGHVIVHGTTVTWNLQLSLLPDPSKAVQVTSVFPTGKQYPDGGLQEMLEIVPQLSVAAGAG